MCKFHFRNIHSDELLKTIINNNNNNNNNNNQNNNNNFEENNLEESSRYDTEDFVMFTVAVILFCVGSVIAVINAYCMGTRCLRVGSNRDIAHFSPCTLY